MSVTRAPAARAAEVRQALRAGAEIGLLDVRPEARFAEGHPLFAACMDADRLELEAVRRLPRADAPLVVYGEDEPDGMRAAQRLGELGYRDVRVLEGGAAGWRADGGELFADVNSPSKAFGELVAERRATPWIEPAELRRLLDQRAAVTVLDARRPDEYRTMSVPSAASAPGATLVRAVAARPPAEELIVVNCAGRTRSIIGAQSLINAGVGRRVAALLGGTIGWTLAGLELEHGQDRRAEAPVSERARVAARRLADRAGVRRLGRAGLDALVREGERTLYCLDVRSPEAFAAGHLPGFRSAPGGQLVQETDHHAPVRGAILVLADDGGSEADMTGSWLAQMGWEVAVLDNLRAATGGERGPVAGPSPPLPEIDWWTADDLAALLGDPALAVLDLGRHRDHLAGHVPGAVWASRTALLRGECELPAAAIHLITADDPALVAFGAADLSARLGARVVGLAGGTPAWVADGRTLERGAGRSVSTPRDRYRRPYEGVDVSPEAMHAYLEWEYGLVAQLERDGTHRFTVLDGERDRST